VLGFFDWGVFAWGVSGGAGTQPDAKRVSRVFFIGSRPDGTVGEDGAEIVSEVAELHAQFDLVEQLGLEGPDACAAATRLDELADRVEEIFRRDMSGGSAGGDGAREGGLASSPEVSPEVSSSVSAGLTRARAPGSSSFSRGQGL